MCRMIAFASARPVDAGPFVDALARLCRTGAFIDRWEKRPGGNHPDGWGVAWRDDVGWRLKKSGLPAAADPTLASLSVRTGRFLGHVRFASNPATVRAENSHPFSVGDLLVAHNGTFRGRFGEEGDRRGISDTLVFAEHLADAWPGRTFEGLADALGVILGNRELVGLYTAANLLVASGDAVFALRRFRKDPGYYTLYLREEGEAAVAASEPLDDRPGWRLLGDGELVALAPGACRTVRLPLPPSAAGR